MTFIHRNCQSQRIEKVRKNMEGRRDSEIDNQLNKLSKPGCFFINDLYECINTDNYNIEALNTANENTLLQLYDILKEQKQYKKIKEIFGELNVEIDTKRPEIKYIFGDFSNKVNFQKGLKHKIRGARYNKILKARQAEILEAIAQDPSLMQKLMTHFGYKHTLQEKKNRYLGLCPVHKENTPSFTMTKNGERSKCLGCGKSGDIIKVLAMLRNEPSYIKNINPTYQALQHIKKTTHPTHN